MSRLPRPMRLTADPAHANFRPSSLNGIANQMHVTAELRKGARAGETVLCRGKGGHVILELDAHPFRSRFFLSCPSFAALVYLTSFRYCCFYCPSLFLSFTHPF